MIKWLLNFFFGKSPVVDDPTTIDIDESVILDNLSHKDFTGNNLSEQTIEPQDIVGSCFAQVIPDTECFPPNMRGVTFSYCNLDNCVIPEGNTIIECSQLRYSVQNDLNDWEIDANGIPTNIVNYLPFYKAGVLPPNPADIPDAPVDERIEHEDFSRNVKA